jgi:hypothetical protein
LIIALEGFSILLFDDEDDDEEDEDEEDSDDYVHIL